MDFDIENARKAGYSDEEIANFLGRKSNFNVTGARNSGYSDVEIVDHLAKLPPPPTTMERIVDAFTGNLRATPEVQEALDAERTIYDMPETNELSWGVVKSALGGLFAGSKERAQILSENFPGVTVREDKQGNQWIKSAKDGREYVIPPGFKMEDIPRTAALLGVFTPAGRAKSLLGVGAAGGATQAVIEGTQAAAGGEFNPEDVAVAAVVPPAAMGTVNAARAVATPVREVVRSLRGQPLQAVTPQAAEAVAPVAQTMPAEDIAKTAKRAAEGGFGSNRAKNVLAEQAAPDPKVAEAAKRLGIDEHLQPDHITTNQAYRELAQAVKSIPGSEARAAELQGLESVAKRADDLIEEIGGTNDLSQLDSGLKRKLRSTHEELKSKADTLYREVRDNVPLKSEVSADNVLALIGSRADELGGTKNLSSMERMILAKLSPKSVSRIEEVPGNPLTPGAQTSSRRTVQEAKQPTYALLDDVRRDLTAAKYARQGPFKDSDDRLINLLEGALRKDQEAAAARYGMSETWNLAQQTSAAYKGIQDDLSALFGKHLDQSVVGDLSSAVLALPRGDVSKLARLLKSVPEDMRREVVASGLNSAFGKTARNGQLNFASYAKWYEGLLRNKQAYTAVMANLPAQARRQLKDLYRVSKGISAASRERITTGRINVIKDELKSSESLVSNIYNLARRIAAAAPAEAATSAAGAPGTGTLAAVMSALSRNKTPAIKAADELIASDEFIALAKLAGKSGEKKARLRLVHSKPFKQYVREVGQSRELSDPERWVLQSMQAQNQNQQR